MLEYLTKWPAGNKYSVKSTLLLWPRSLVCICQIRNSWAIYHTYYCTKWIYVFTSENIILSCIPFLPFPLPFSDAPFFHLLGLLYDSSILIKATHYCKCKKLYFVFVGLFRWRWTIQNVINFSLVLLTL